MNDERLIDLYLSGAKYREIAEIAGWSDANVQKRLAKLREIGRIPYRRSPLPASHPKRQLAVLRRDAVGKLADRGASYKQIAQQLGICETYARKIMEEMRPVNHDQEIARLNALIQEGETKGGQLHDCKFKSQ